MKPRVLWLGLAWLGGCSRSELVLPEPIEQPVICIDRPIELKNATAQILFVLDRSASMRNPMAVADRTRSRWQALGDVLGSTLSGLNAKDLIGAMLFPSTAGSESCVVNDTATIAPAAGSVSAIVALMQSASPGGSTPTATALDVAARTLLSMRATQHSRAIVLATDGAPDCNAGLNVAECRCAMAESVCTVSTRCLDDQRTVKQIAKARDQGIPTFVIGIESEGDARFSDVLNAMAVAGGRARVASQPLYYAAKSEAELAESLATVSNQVERCSFLTASVPDANEVVELTLDGIPLAENQWSWTDHANGELTLNAALCERVAAQSDIQLHAKAKCVADETPP